MSETPVTLINYTGMYTNKQNLRVIFSCSIPFKNLAESFQVLMAQLFDTNNVIILTGVLLSRSMVKYRHFQR